MAKVIGSVLLEAKKYINEKKENGFQELVKKSENHQTSELADSIIMATEWYDLDIWLDILSLIKKEYGTEEFKNIQYQMAQSQLTGVLGMLAKFASLDRILNGAQDNWKKFYTDGVLKAERPDENTIKTSISGIKMTYDFAESLQYYLEKLVEICSKKTVRGSFKHTGDTSAEYEFHLE